MQNTQVIVNNLKSSAKSYASGVMELVRYEAVSIMEKAGTKAVIFVMAFLVFSMAAGWLSFAMVSFLTRSLTIEAASAIMGMLLLAGGYALVQTQKPKSGNKTQLDPNADKIDSPQKQILLNQIEGAKAEFIDSAREVKSISIEQTRHLKESLSPTKSVKAVVTNNPGAILLGGFALGVFLGTKNMRPRGVRII